EIVDEAFGQRIGLAIHGFFRVRVAEVQAGHDPGPAIAREHGDDLRGAGKPLHGVVHVWSPLGCRPAPASAPESIPVARWRLCLQPLQTAKASFTVATWPRSPSATRTFATAIPMRRTIVRAQRAAARRRSLRGIARNAKARIAGCGLFSYRDQARPLIPTRASLPCVRSSASSGCSPATTSRPCA